MDTSTTNNKTDDVSCKQCKCVFSTKHGLAIHSAKCNGINPKQCQTCGKVFSSTNHKNRHQRNANCHEATKYPQWFADVLANPPQELIDLIQRLFKERVA